MAARRNLSAAIASAALVYAAAGALLVAGLAAFVKRDVARLGLGIRA